MGMHSTDNGLSFLFSFFPLFLFLFFLKDDTVYVDDSVFVCYLCTSSPVRQ